MHIRYLIYALSLAVLVVLAWRDPRVHGDFLSAFVPVATAIAVVEIVFRMIKNAKNHFRDPALRD